MDNYQSVIRTNIAEYLQAIGEVDKYLPEAPDIEELWAKVGEAYLPDAMREFEKYPTVALGWIMYVGMAVAKYWDVDWDLYSKVENHYGYLRDQCDFDHLDDYVSEKVLLLEASEVERLRRIVGECAARVDNQLVHLPIEHGTEDAFCTFVAALHQMYLMGVAMQLKRMGYHMTKLGE
ncbi:MAG: hypothetical protein LIR46_04510 [Bacteroidota bacterium]|nr:hypothetical protein [Bacteroidota bacterium]